MKFINYALILSFFLFFNCKKGDQTNTPNKDLTPESSVIKTPKNKKDFIIIDLNLTMEWAIRKDSLILTKDKNSTYISGIIKQKVEGVDEDFTITYLEPQSYSSNQDSSSLASLIKKYKSKRFKGNVYLLKVYEEDNNILTLYSDNLAERNDFIEDYKQIMSKIYPDKEIFSLKTY